MNFPRPPIDTGFGVHDSASAHWEPHGQHYSYAKLLRDHGITWYLMWIWDINKADYAQALIANGIMPIVRIGPAKMPRPQIDMGIVDAYMAVGVKWFILGNEFNLFEEWDSEDNWKGIDKPLRHVADWYVRIADEIRAKGGWPITPPPSLGGHWLHRDWFIRFMTALTNIAKEQGRSLKSLLYPGAIGIHCRSCGNPLEDGPENYDCSAREWEWFDETVRRFLIENGEPEEQAVLPLCNGEWGDEPGWSKRKNPHFDNRQKWQWWENRNIEQIRWCWSGNQGYRYPDRVFANCFWVIHDGGTWDDCGLLNNRTYLREMGGTDTTRLWEALPGLITWDEHDPSQPPPEPPTPIPPVPQPPSEIEFVGLTEEMIEMLAVTGPDDPSAPYWKVVKVEIQPGTDNQSAYAIADMVKPFTVNFFWSGGEKLENSKADPYAPVGAQANAASMPLFNPWGPYGVEIYGNSEALVGFGLYGDPPDLHIKHTAHHPTLVYFQLVQPDAPEPPEPPVPPEPDIDYTLLKGMASRGLTVVDDREFLMKYAKMNLVGIRSTDNKTRKFLYKLITIHHTAGDEPLSVKGLAKWHTDAKPTGRGFAHISYHFVIDKDGTVHFTKPLRLWSEQNGRSFVNQVAIGIAVHGLLTEKAATDAQLRSLKLLIESLEEWIMDEWGKRYPLPVVPHFWLVDTACPGGLYEQYRAHLDN